jgi:hypothetical protein
MDLHQLVEWKVPLPVIEVLSTYPEDFPLGRVRAVQQWVDDPLLVVYHHAVPGRVDYWEKARESIENPAEQYRVRLIIKKGSWVTSTKPASLLMIVLEG